MKKTNRILFSILQKILILSRRFTLYVLAKKKNICFIFFKKINKPERIQNVNFIVNLNFYIL